MQGGLIRTMAMVSKRDRRKVGRRLDETPDIRPPEIGRFDRADHTEVAGSIICAAVEVGAIPYRERYQPRRYASGTPNWSALSAACRAGFPKVLAYLHTSEKQGA